MSRFPPWFHCPAENEPCPSLHTAVGGRTSWLLSLLYVSGWWPGLRYERGAYAVAALGTPSVGYRAAVLVGHDPLAQSPCPLWGWARTRRPLVAGASGRP